MPSAVVFGPLVASLWVLSFVVVAVAAVVWVALDASARGRSAVAWGVGALVFWPVVLPYYVLWWRRNHDRERPRTTGERTALIVWTSGLVAIVIAWVVAPPDPFTQSLASLVAFAVCLPFMWWLTR